MNYFLNVNLGLHLTGIEHAAIKRLRLFKKMNKTAKIVTINFNTQLSKHIKNASLDHADVINMYDYYQGAGKNYKSNTLYDLIEMNPNYTYKSVKNSSDFKFYENGKYVMYVHCADLETMIINYINYFDEGGRKVKRELYDCRGFKSNQKILGDNQVIIMESFFKVTGEVCIEKFYKMTDGKNELTSVILSQDNGRKHFFNSEKELITQFLEDLVINNAGDVEVIYFSDKNKIIMPSLLEVSQPCKKIPIIHSVHVRDPQRIMDGDYNVHYKLIFNNFDKIDACVVSTANQKGDIEKRFSSRCPIYDISPGYVQEVKRIPVNERKKNRILCTARYFSEKRLDHIIKAVHKIQTELPHIELHLFGFGNAGDSYKVEKELRNLIKELNLEDRVFLMGYTPDIEKELDDYQLFILTSTIEGFCLSLLEALSHGIPSISYDIKYGPADMIHAGENGYLVLDGDINELANKMLEFLTLDNNTKQTFSDNAYKYSKYFSEAAIMNKWNVLLEEITNPPKTYNDNI